MNSYKKVTNFLPSLYPKQYTPAIPNYLFDFIHSHKSSFHPYFLLLDDINKLINTRKWLAIIRVQVGKKGNFLVYISEVTNN